jgi:hypothetical protein
LAQLRYPAAARVSIELSKSNRTVDKSYDIRKSEGFYRNEVVLFLLPFKGALHHLLQNLQTVAFGLFEISNTFNRTMSEQF